MSQVKDRFVRIQRIDAERQVVQGVVYEPNVIDTWGEMMIAEDIALVAERFLEDCPTDKAIDTQHDNVPNGSLVTESFIVRAGDPDYPEGAWVLGVKITDPDVWQQVKSGELNGFSFEAMTRRVPAVVEVEIFPHNVGVTAESVSHTHLYLAQMNDDGVIVSGRTTTDMGHSHEIKAGTSTEQENGHRHRFVLSGGS